MLCDFCGERITSDPDNEECQTVDDALDLHYIESCKMLTSCEACNKIIEISKLTSHLLGECDFRDRYVECEQCGDALKKEKQHEHSCVQKSGLDLLKCPMCNKYCVGKRGTLKDWQKHLV